MVFGNTDGSKKTKKEAIITTIKIKSYCNGFYISDGKCEALDKIPTVKDCKKCGCPTAIEYRRKNRNLGRNIERAYEIDDSTDDYDGED